MGLQDLPFVVATHLHHFPDSFFARLGPRFMTRYYRTFLDGPIAAAAVAEVEGEVCGYLVGVLDGTQHRRLLMRHHGVGLAITGILGMCWRPWLAWIFTSTRLRRYANAFHRSRQSGTSASRPAEKVAVLSHVAVSENYRFRGVGSLLISDFLQQAESAGCARVCLLTRAGDGGASRYYDSHQWERAEEPASSPAGHFVRYQRGLPPASRPNNSPIDTAATL